MAYKKAKSLKFPGLPDTYTIPQVADGASGNAAILDGNGNVGDSGIPAAKIAQVDGSYSQMNVGTADNLVDKTGTGTPQEIVFRPTAGMRSIEKASAEIKSIYGKTLVWNQLVENGNFVDTTGWIFAKQNFFSVSEGVLVGEVPSGTATDSLIVRKNISLENGHKYFFSAQIKKPNAVTMRISYNADSISTHQIATVPDNSTDFVNIERVFAANLDNVQNAGLRFAGNMFPTGEGYSIKNVLIVDLTAMFGSGNEPSTVDEFRALFPLPYYAYDAGSLLNFTGTGIKTVGFNQWDEEWEIGYYFHGVKLATDLTRIRSKNYIPVFPNTQYYAKVGGTEGLLIGYLDINKNWISDTGNMANKTFTTPENCYYIVIWTGSGTGTVYNHDICINLSWSGYRNGEYEPFWTETKNLPISTYFPDGMKSAGAVRDELTRDRAVKRCGTRAYQTGDEEDASVVTDETNTVYVLSEPVETPIDPPLNFVYRVDDFGTEQLLPENDDEPTTTPLNASIYYDINYVREVENLPKNYQSQDSMDELLESIESKTGDAFVKEWDSEHRKWKYTYTPKLKFEVSGNHIALLINEITGGL